jgi:hypothetical protein
MSNFSDDQLADLRERLHDLMMGFARGDSAGMTSRSLPISLNSWGISSARR